MSFVTESNGDGHSKAKKPRLKKGDEALDNSQCFAPFRAIGLITTEVPFILQTKGVEHFAITCIGQSYHIYKCSKLALAYVGAQHAKRIRCMAALKNFIFVGTGNQVLMWKRSQLLRHFDLPRHCKPTILHVFGKHILVYSAVDNCLRMWHIFDGTLHATIQFPATFHVTSIMHPETYLNKILFGSSEGPLQLWNLKTNKLVYTFKGWDSGVTVLEQSPAVDVIAIGLSNGKIIVHNLKLDQSITQFHQAEGAVTALTFRTDSHPILASGGPTGTLVIWDLEKKKLLTLVPAAHNRSISSIRFLHAEPVMISSGDDNSLKMWIFDSSDGSPRLLRSRDAHYQTPSRIRYYGNKPQILSCAPDRQLRLFNTFIDAQNREISQGKHIISKAKRYGTSVEELKLPPILDFDSSPSKEREWDNIITCHQDHNKAYTWNFENKVQGRHTLISTGPKNSAIKSVAISSCGNFGIIGTAGGYIDKFNMQSGIHRGCFIDGEKKSFSKCSRSLYRCFK